jgi:YD repeat-containing protein
VSEVAGLKVRGPVRTCRHEAAEWDQVREIWQPPRLIALATFRPDGQVSEGESHSADGSVARWAYAYDDAGRPIEVQSWTDDGPRSIVLHAYDQAGRRTGSVHVAPDGTRREADVCTYDSNGRKTTVSFLPDPGPNVIAVGIGMGGSEVGPHGTPGAATMTVTYDDRGLPAAGILRDANQALVHRVVHSRDKDGRLLSEAVHSGGETLLPPTLAAVRSPEEQASMAALLAQVFANQTFAAMTYVYDEKGRVRERTMRMGGLSEERTTFRYNDHDDATDELSEHHTRDAHVDDNGVLQTRNEMRRTAHTRFDYQYDEQGNWTEQVVWIQSDLRPDFQRSNIIRRTITYY